MSKGSTQAPQLRLIQDESSHWYLIPLDLLEEFDDWIFYHDDEFEEPWSGTEFELYSINGPHTLIIHDYTDEA